MHGLYQTCGARCAVPTNTSAHCAAATGHHKTIRHICLVYLCTIPRIGWFRRDVEPQERDANTDNVNDKPKQTPKPPMMVHTMQLTSGCHDLYCLFFFLLLLSPCCAKRVITKSIGWTGRMIFFSCFLIVSCAIREYYIQRVRSSHPIC